MSKSYDTEIISVGTEGSVNATLNIYSPSDLINALDNRIFNISVLIMHAEERKVCKCNYEHEHNKKYGLFCTSHFVSS